MKETVTSALNLGYLLNRFSINISFSKKNKEICYYLFKVGVINSFFINRKSKKITLSLSYFYDKKPIRYIKKISTPGRKVYITYLQLKKMLLYRNSLLILSTSKGILNNKEAIVKRIGGELLFFIKC